MEVFGDPIFDPYELSGNDVREPPAKMPRSGGPCSECTDPTGEAPRVDAKPRQSPLGRTNRGPTMDAIHLPTEEVSDFVQRNSNYFPDLEAGAEKIRQVANIEQKISLPVCLVTFTTTMEFESKLKNWFNERCRSAL